jgi:hypothetical protein
MDPPHEPGSSNGAPPGEKTVTPTPEDERFEKAVLALTHGNAPRKALEHYRNGDQDLETVVKSVMHYFNRGRDYVEAWRDPVERAIERIATPAPDREEKA